MRKRNEALKTKYKVQLGSAFSSKGQERHLARMLQAVALMDKEKWEKAEKILLQLKDKCTSLADTTAIYLLYGMSCEGRGNREKAAGVYKELLARGENVDFDKLHAEIVARDKQDTERAFSPLVCADDAIVLDTSNMTLDEVVAVVKGYIQAKV